MSRKRVLYDVGSPKTVAEFSYESPPDEAMIGRGAVELLVKLRPELRGIFHDPPTENEIETAKILLKNLTPEKKRKTRHSPEEEAEEFATPARLSPATSYFEVYQSSDPRIIFAEVKQAVPLSRTRDVFKAMTTEIASFGPETATVSVMVPRPHSREGEALAKLLVARGFRQRNDDWFVLPIRNVKVPECTNLVEITTENRREFQPLLPAIMALCPDYFTSSVLKELGPRNSLFVLLNSTNLPCAAALTKWSSAGVQITVLCSIVKGAGRVIFDRVTDIAAARGAPSLDIYPANKTLKVMYSNWMGNRSVPSDKPGFLTMRVIDE